MLRIIGCIFLACCASAAAFGDEACLSNQEVKPEEKACGCECEPDSDDPPIYENSKITEPPQPQVSWPGKNEDPWYEQFTR